MSKKGRLARRVIRNQRRSEEQARKRRRVDRLERKKMASQGTSDHGIVIRKGEEAGMFLPFGKEDKVMLIGEGDFSFSVSIIEAGYIKPENLIATSFDTLEQLKAKYPEVAEQNLQKLTDLGIERVIHGVDCTKLIKTLKLSENPKKIGRNIHILNGLRVDLVMFNFPHVGKGITDRDRNIRANQELMSGFFKNCIALFELLASNRQQVIKEKEDKEKEEEALRGQNVQVKKKKKNHNKGKKKSRVPPVRNPDSFPFGRIAVTMFNGEPYDRWHIKKLAKVTIGYQVCRSGKFDWNQFQGYHHRKTAGMNETTKVASTRRAKMYLFESRRIAQIKNRKRKREESESEDEE